MPHIEPGPDIVDFSTMSTEETNRYIAEYLDEILKQLKIMNFHLALVTDNWLTKSDVLE